MAEEEWSPEEEGEGQQRSGHQLGERGKIRARERGERRVERERKRIE